MTGGTKFMSMRRPAALFASIAVVTASFVVPWFASDASASSPVVSSYTGTGIDNPGGIAAGSDGALWFTNSGNNSIGRVTTAGVVSNYTGSSIDGPGDIAAGSDGALWFTQGGGSIGRITTAGVVTNYPNLGAGAITAGPDGDLWFTTSQGIGSITTSGVVTNYTSPQGPPWFPDAIAAGPDGALWVTSFVLNSIFRVTTGGVFTDFPGTATNGVSGPTAIAAGPDGALWFTNTGSNPTNGSIGRITTAGVISSYTGTGISYPNGIAAGPDGALWFTNAGSAGTINPSIGRITTAGVVTNYTDPSISGTGQTGDGPTPDIAAGSDGALWFTNNGKSVIGGTPSIGRITTGSSSSPPPTTRVIIPSSSGTTVSGTAAILDASASNATTVEFLLFGGVYGLNAPVACTATQTYYGWICSWDTTTAPNGSYILVSYASGPGGSATSASGVKVTVRN